MHILSTPSILAERRVLNAALTLFARHGFQRTSMADVARETGIARATLYLRFADKRSLFAALAASLVDDALAAVETAWDAEAALSANIASALLARDLGFFRLRHATPHGAELIGVDAELTASHAVRLDAEFLAILCRHGEAAERRGADLHVFGGAAGFAAFLATAGAGLKHETRNETDYRAAVVRLARVAARAAGTD